MPSYRKLIKSIDEAVFSFFPEYSDLRTPERDKIQLRHLLTMTSGLGWNENVPYDSVANTERPMNRSADPYRYALDRKVWNNPGEIWNYNGGCTMLLGAVLQKVTGKSLRDFAKEALFEPLGITDFDWINLTRVVCLLQPADFAYVRGIWRRSVSWC